MTAEGTTAQGPTLYATMSDTFGDIVEAIAQSDRLLAAMAAQRAQLIDQARQWVELTEGVAAADSRSRVGWTPQVVARRVLFSELACALRVPERTAENLVEHSRMLVHELPATRAALREGTISYRHAEKIADHAASLPAEARASFEEAVVEPATRLTVARFDQQARRVRERLHPESIAARAAKGAADRTVSVGAELDGMAWLSAYLPAEKAIGIDNRLTEIARGLRTPDERRTLAQLRADVFGDLLVDGVTGGGTGRGIRAKVLVTVPVLSLLGRTDEPASVEGYGPIPLETARELAAHAPSFTRILTHPETGAVLSVGRDHYAVPKDLRLAIRVRDEMCRFPGCGRRAEYCEVDHIVDRQFGGPTDHDNLAHLCKKHHRLKHQTPWTVRYLERGTLEWRSPSGRIYTTRPSTELGSSPPDVG